MTTAQYRVVVANLNGSDIAEVPAKNLQFSYALNDKGAIDFTLPTRHSKCTKDILDPGKRELRVYRNDDLVWGGYLWVASPQIDEVRFNGDSYWSRLERRRITENIDYMTMDQFDIVWNLIDWTQAQTGGALGFTRASAVDSGVTRTRHYCAVNRRQISDAIAKLAASGNGFDFEIDANKEWRTYYPNKGTVTDYMFELGKNIRNMSYVLDATETMSEVTGLGSGEGCDRILASAVNTSSRTAYGLLQGVVEDSDLDTTTEVTNLATEELNQVKGQILRPQLAIFTTDPPFGSVSVGDWVNVKADLGYIDIDDSFRVSNITIAISDEGFEAQEIFLQEAIV